ncbi:MAG: hypothetical protein JSR29_15865 [Nitrospira sp.]|nr:hypothetical protein [Nitrospira sp.]
MSRADIEKLANLYNPYYEKPLIFDLRPSYQSTGNPRQDVYNLIVSKREDEIVGIAQTLDLSRWAVSQIIRGFVKDGVFTWEQIYQLLPKVREAHERVQRKRETTRTTTTQVRGLAPKGITHHV